MPARNRYSQQNKRYFWQALEHYARALRLGGSFEIIVQSLNVHRALADVPKSYKRYVSRAFNTCGDEADISEQEARP